jgi:hypothetical protein
MDRYERLILDVRQKTKDEIIHWKVAKAGRYSDVVLNSSRVIRAFTADYPVGKNTFELLFVERRVEFHDDFGNSSEGYGFELFILDQDKQVVLSLYEGIVDRDDLLSLSGLIDQHNDRAKDFFDAFEEPGAA